MDIIEVWVVYDGGDDRSYGSPAFFYSSEIVANAKAKGSGWYGGDAHVEKRRAICVESGHPGSLDTYYLIDHIGEIDVNLKQEKERQRLRKQAKSKLSKEELEALDVKD